MGLFVEDTTEDPRYSRREEVLEGATLAVMKQRNNTYGPPTQDFSRTAGILRSLGFAVVDAAGEVAPIEAHHVAMIQAAVKLSRLMWSPDHRDSWVDLAGYAACGFECAMEGKDK